MTSSRSFYGRATELASLQAAFAAVATAGNGPRMVTLVAHTGIGKTRLAHEFYRWLSNHPKWDATDYWPDDLGSDKDTLRSNPELPANHAGQPLFLWWGMRAANGADRNHADEGAMSRAAGALRHLRTINETVTGKVLGHGLAEAGGMALDLAIGPLGNLGRTIVKGLDHKKARAKGSREEKEDQLRSLSDELLDALRHFLHTKKLPVVVFVDDAQWIDAESMGMLNQLWNSATTHKWPLLVLATHWETEWNQNLRLRGAERDATLARFVGDPRVTVEMLKFSPSADLAAWVRTELPGLTPKQVNLLVEKAGANFLQMTQNARGLQRMAKTYFTGGTAQGALTPAGERYVGSFETDPVKRAKQLFEELPPGVQSALGWSSHFGMRFLREVAVAFAARMGVRLSSEPDIEPAAALREAVDPLAILSHAADGSENLTEFRQGAFHAVARKHLSVLVGDDTSELDAALREVLQEWINNSFDEDAEVIYPEEPEEDADAVAAATTPTKAASLLAEEEQRDLLAWALKLFPRPERPDWSNADHVLAIRAGLLALRLELANDKPVRAAELGRERFMESAAWNAPLEALGALAQDQLASDLGWVNLHNEAAGWLRWQLSWVDEAVSEDRVGYWRYDAERRLADQLSTLGKFKEAAELSARSLAYAREQVEQAKSDDQRNYELASLAWRLTEEGDLRSIAGRLPEAKLLHDEALAIRRKLASKLGTPMGRRDLSNSLDNVAGIEEANGAIDAALAKYEESLAISRELASDLGTPESRRDLLVSLSNVANIEVANGDLESALAKYEESLAISSKLASDLGTLESRADVSVSLGNVAKIEKEKGARDSARARYEESLAIDREVASKMGTPRSRRRVFISLHSIARIEEQNGDFDSALAKYEESLAIARELASELGTLESRRDVWLPLGDVADIEEKKGKLESALAKFEEGLAIARELASELSTPQSRRDVSLSLNKVAGIEQANGDLDSALAKYEESLAIRRELASELGTRESRRDVSVSLDSVAGIEKANGDLDSALAKYEESLAIRRELAAELGTPESRRDVSVSLNKVANIEKANGDLDSALAKYEESLAIRRELASELGTPASRRDVSVSLDNVAGIEQANGDLDSALAKYEEGLAINLGLHAELGRESDCNDVVWGTGLVASLLLKQADANTADHRLDACAHFVGALEASEDPNHVDSAAAHWEHKAACANALGREADATTYFARARQLRERLASMEGGAS